MLVIWSLAIVVISTVNNMSVRTSNTVLVTEWNKCAKTDNKIRTFYKPISLELCVKQCTRRAHCVGVNYWRRTGLCDLLGSVTGFVSSEVPCVHVSGPVVEDATCGCSPGEKCSESSNKCSPKECPVQHVHNGKVHGNMQAVGSKATMLCQDGDQYVFISIVECPVQHVQNGKVHGNMQAVGSKATVVCQAGAQYVLVSIVECPVQHVHNGKVHGNMQDVGSKAIVVCQSGAQYVASSGSMVCGGDGSWTNVHTCLIHCPGPPCSRFTHTKPAVGDGLLPGATRDYICKPGYSTTNGGAAFNITCLSDSTWSVPETYCKGAGESDDYSIVGCQVLYFSISHMTNEAAVLSCTNLGGDLIRIDTEEKQTTLVKYIKANGLDETDYWIQGKRNEIDRKWYWSDGSEMTQYFWAPGKPDGGWQGKQNYIRMEESRDYKWNDRESWYSFKVICELFDE